MRRTGNNAEDARDLRQRMTPAEERLWAALRGRQAAGWIIRRKHPVGACVLDFATPSLRLAIEPDGSVHDTRQEDDAARALVLAGESYRLLRCSNQCVLADLDGVIVMAAAALRAERWALPRTLRPLQRAKGSG